MKPCSIDNYFDSEKGNVTFDSGRHGWAFTLPQYARLLEQLKRTDTSLESCAERLWDDRFFSSTGMKWHNIEQAQAEHRGAHAKRGFKAHVLESLYSMLHFCADENVNMIRRMLANIQIQSITEKLDTTIYDSDDIMFNAMNT